MLLALDLSTAHGSIAVVRGDDVLFRSSFQSERSHNAQVFAPLREALAVAGSELTGIVIGNGPGSYTGVRIAIAAAQGIALSRNVWCVGWSSLTAPDVDAPASFSVIGDARRQSFYLARVENGRLLPDLDHRRDRLQQRIPNHLTRLLAVRTLPKRSSRHEGAETRLQIVLSLILGIHERHARVEQVASVNAIVLLRLRLL